MDNVIEFKKPIVHQETMDSRYMKLVEMENMREKYWSHVCPGIGLISQPGTVCGRCLQKKPKGNL